MTMLTDIRQSALYTQFMHRLGWLVEKIDGVNIFIKPFPLIGATIKIQRANKLPNLHKLQALIKKYHCRSISFEPDTAVIPNSFRDLKALEMLKQVQHDSNHFQFLNNPYLPTKTILIDLTPSETTIFHRFSEAKQRAVRRAQKGGVIVIQSDTVDEFIKLKNKTAGLLGFLTTTTLKPLWQTFAPKQAVVLLAYCPVIPSEALAKSRNLYPSYADLQPKELSNQLRGSYTRTNLSLKGITQQTQMKRIPPRSASWRIGRDDKVVAGILLLFHEKTAYYWIAAATDAGKKSFAPTLLVWEALKLAKQKGCTTFNFEGIFDERYPNLNKNWLGFTKFKQGFGGEEVCYPKPVQVRP